MDQYPSHCLNGLISVTRARDFHLYTASGKRYLDCYQDDGRAVLGHRPGRLGLALKDGLGKGVLAGYPSPYETRLKRALEACFPGFGGYRWYGSNRNAEDALKRITGVDASMNSLPDPAVNDEQETANNAVLWRPYLAMPGMERRAAVVPVIPFPGGMAPVVVCFTEDPGPDEYSDPVSQVVLRGLIRVVYDLKSFTASLTDGRRDGSYWSVFDTPLFRRRGPYIVPVCGNEAYEQVFMAFYNGEIILHPVYPGPSILPAEWSDGELKAFIRTAAAVREG